MFGYVNVNRTDLSAEEQGIYQSYYCSLCRSLKEKYGKKGQLLLNYDITFLSLLLTGLYEPEEERGEFKCALHPVKNKAYAKSSVTAYAADMNVLLAYHNLMDDYYDHKSHLKKKMADSLLPDYDRIKEKYPRQAKAVEEYMDRLHAYEQANETNAELVAGLTGDMLGELFAMREDEWYQDLKNLGLYLGKFIYLMDAYEDLDKDVKSGSYNPLREVRAKDPDNFEAVMRLILTSQMSECAKSFERLPILKNVEILRNIIYSGVWTKYEYLKARKKKGNS